jgi:luciferase-like monooxygenase
MRRRPPGRVRGIGAGRKTRRNLERGGTGPAAELNEVVGGWARVKITPMFGRWGYFVGPRLFGCFPLRAKDTDLWIRLAPEDARRALATPGIVPHRRLAASGWVECEVETPRDVGRAIRWLRRSYRSAVLALEREERSGP